MQAKSILVPVILASRRQNALRFVRALAAETPVAVTLLYVVNLNILAPEGRVYREVCVEAEKQLSKLAVDFFGDREAVQIRVRLGKAHEEILAEAQSRLFEFIILSGRKPSRWKTLFGTGTIERVVRHAPCPTLVLPDEWKLPVSTVSATTVPPNTRRRGREMFSFHA